MKVLNILLVRVSCKSQILAIIKKKLGLFCHLKNLFERGRLAESENIALG